MSADYAWWRAAVAGQKPLIYETPECGYFKLRDRRGLNKQKAAIKRPWVACAIWLDEVGKHRAELAGTATEADRIWPYCAKYPIPYEDYAFWHSNERFPEKAA